MIKRELIFIQDKSIIIGRWVEDKTGRRDVTLVENVKDCTIFNNGQDCRYLTSKAMDPYTHHIMVHPNGCIEFEKRENVKKLLTEEIK